MIALTPDRCNLMLRLEGVRKAFKDQVAVDDVSLDVEAGQVVAIIGPSGSGKSTLLRCINLLEIPDRGRITVEGSRPTPRAASARRSS